MLGLAAHAHFGSLLGPYVTCPRAEARPLPDNVIALDNLPPSWGEAQVREFVRPLITKYGLPVCAGTLCVWAMVVVLVSKVRFGLGCSDATACNAHALGGREENIVRAAHGRS